MAVVRSGEAGEVARRLRAALDAAGAFVAAMPSGMEGVLFLRDGRAVLPEVGGISGYVAHEGRRAGHWPSSSEIGGAMLEG